jgi:hypothetical protein
MPAVSVLMVFHRVTPFLLPAVRSVLEQTLGDLELVLVDNGTGLPAEVLGEAGVDPRVRWVRLPRNEGIPIGHNAGVAAARGEFVALLDYDDVALPQRLERQVATLRANPKLGLVSALAEQIDAEGRVVGRVFCLPEPEAHWAYAQFAAPLITPAATGRREVFVELPYRPEFPFSADLDFQARVVERWRTAVLPEILLRYRWYPAQTTQRQIAAIEQSRCTIQLLTARRRAGRPENLEGTRCQMAGSSAAESWRRTAAQCLEERFSVLAAYHARRSFALDRSTAAALVATRLTARAWRQARGRERWMVLRMFFIGPVRALGLRPA